MSSTGLTLSNAAFWKSMLLFIYFLDESYVESSDTTWLMLPSSYYFFVLKVLKLSFWTHHQLFLCRFIYFQGLPFLIACMFQISLGGILPYILRLIKIGKFSIVIVENMVSYSVLRYGTFLGVYVLFKTTFLILLKKFNFI